MRLFLLTLCLLVGSAHSAGLGDLSQNETGNALKSALNRGVSEAVDHLGVPDGFLKNDQVRIPLPPALEKAEHMLRQVGMGQQADDLVSAMNHAAESAVPLAKPLLVKAITHMSWTDAKAILMGPDDAGTQYFRKVSEADLTQKFLPVIHQDTVKVKLAEQYDKVAKPAAELGLISKDDADLDTYVTHKALDGLFLIMAQKEKAIRQDPLGQGSKLIGKVFGALLGQ